MKKHYLDFNRKAVVVNSLQRYIADLQAHVDFLVRSNNVDELELLNSKISSFLDTIKSEFINSLPDNE
ncbi:MAG: hypothetical protein IJA96_05630 [Alistipes sp.]|nr:hypothetical protein [Alistipes sp.]